MNASDTNIVGRLRKWICGKIGHVFRVTHWSVDSLTLTCWLCGKRESI